MVRPGQVPQPAIRGAMPEPAHQTVPIRQRDQPGPLQAVPAPVQERPNAPHTAIRPRPVEVPMEALPVKVEYQPYNGQQVPARSGVLVVAPVPASPATTTQGTQTEAAPQYRPGPPLRRALLEIGTLDGWEAEVATAAVAAALC